MNWKRTARWSWSILPFLLLAIWPSVAAAQLGVRSDANALLYEVTENLKFKPLASGHRVAGAALMGTVNAGTPLCPVALVGEGGKCGITAMAANNVDINPTSPTLGQGPVKGTFSVVVQDDNSVDGPELMILRGTLHGKINLFNAILFQGSGGTAGSPTGSIDAKWSAHVVKGGPWEAAFPKKNFNGTLNGTFRLPVGSMASAFYFGASGFVPVLDNERSLSVPTVRLEVNFVETHDDDDD